MAPGKWNVHGTWIRSGTGKMECAAQQCAIAHSVEDKRCGAHTEKAVVLFARCRLQGTVNTRKASAEQAFFCCRHNIYMHQLT